MRFFAFLIILLLVGCSNDSQFIRSSMTEFFTQDFNPQNLDVLWVIDNRSPMYRAKDHLISEATRFFQRLDSVSSNYQMAFISMDMEFSKGKLQPESNPLLLKKNIGTVSERASAFSGFISQIINLKTSAENHGFESALASLTQFFPVRPGIPLIIIFLSDGDDHSPLPNGVTDGSDYYLNSFLKIKNEKKELLRIYSVNYVGLSNQTATDKNRCATRYNSDIDSSGFENRYFNLATLLNGGGAPVTSDLCGSFADLIDLTGLRLKVPVKNFTLQKRPSLSSLVVEVSKDKTKIESQWTFDAATQTIVFSEAPPEGSTIQVTYLPE